jgi:hypothetical protein
MLIVPALAPVEGSAASEPATEFRLVHERRLAERRSA